MPVVFRIDGYRFFFFSNEGNEPVHIHVRKAEKLAKFWLEPEIRLAESYDMTSAELRRISVIIRENERRIRSAWDEHFGE